MAKGFRAIVCGDRYWNDKVSVYAALDQFVLDRGPITVVIEGEASGVDRFARQWAEDHGIRVIPCPADWSDLKVPGAVIRHNRYGRKYNAAAGPMRNQRMLKDHAPDIVIAFPGHSGTAGMVLLAEENGVEVFEVEV